LQAPAAKIPARRWPALWKIGLPVACSATPISKNLNNLLDQAKTGPCKKSIQADAAFNFLWGATQFDAAPGSRDATIPVSAVLRENEKLMKQRLWIVLLAAVLLIAGIVFVAQHYLGSAGNSPRESALASLPADATAVLYADASDLRQSPFLKQLYDWAPRPQQVDVEYAKFLRDTGFDYERDLGRVAIAILKRGNESTFFAVADGRFDRKKINTYTSQFGTHESRGGREIFTVPINGGARKISFTFPRQNRIALTDTGDLSTLLTQSMKGEDEKQWRARFDRLAGSPLFAVIRQDAATGRALAQHAPGGLQSPQLSALLDQLLWITIAGKPEGDRLRIVTEGECPAAATARQLSDFLSGALILAQAGLNGPQVRQQLNSQAREAYLEILKGADISRLDRGETKSVRVVFDITPKLLYAASPTAPTAAAPLTPHK
jgi:hypothetical protein